MAAAAGSRRTRTTTSYVLGTLLALAVAACSPAIDLPLLSPVASPPPDSSAVAVVPSATPASRGETAAIAAFVKSVTGGKLSYRVGFKGAVAATVNRLPIDGSMDVSGANFASSFTYDYSHDYRGIGKIRVQVREVGRKGYAKVGSAAWQTLKGYGEEDSNVPFAAVQGADDVTFMGPTKAAGRVAYRVSIPDAVLIHPGTIVGNVASERVGKTTLELVIDDQGRPIVGDWKLVGRARIGASGQLQEIVYDLHLTFSRIGVKVAIARP
jgi:hypothetical protein